MEPMPCSADRMRGSRHVGVEGGYRYASGGVGGAGAHNKKELEEARGWEPDPKPCQPSDLTGFLEEGNGKYGGEKQMTMCSLLHPEWQA